MYVTARFDLVSTVYQEVLVPIVRKILPPLLAAFALFAAGVVVADTLGDLSRRSIVPTAAQSASSGTCAPAPKSTALKIKIMGDSIMTTYRPAPDNATPDTLGWPNLLAAQGATHGWQVDQHGIGGSMASMYLPGGPYHWVAQQVRDAKPDIVTMDFRANEQIGSNGQPKQTPAQLKTNMLALIDFIRETSPGTRFLIVNPPVLWYHEFFTTTHTQADYAVKMWEVAQERNGCWLDLRPFFSQTTKDPDLPDDIHGNNRAHAKIYVAMYSTFLQACPAS